MIYEILSWAALAHLVAQFLEDKNILQFKPFNCNLCLGFWLSVLPLWAKYGAFGIGLAAIVAVSSETIYRLLQRL